MFWDNVACVYDVFANVINRKTNEELCSVVKNLILPEYEVWNVPAAPDYSQKKQHSGAKALLQRIFPKNVGASKEKVP